MEYNCKLNQQGEEMNIMMPRVIPKRGNVKRDIVTKVVHNVSNTLPCVPNNKNLSSTPNNNVNNVDGSPYYPSWPSSRHSNLSTSSFAFYDYLPSHSR